MCSLTTEFLITVVYVCNERVVFLYVLKKIIFKNKAGCPSITVIVLKVTINTYSTTSIVLNPYIDFIFIL
jgi:hypothetical protein